MKCLVIAASGYIGNAVAERLYLESFSVLGTTRNKEAALALRAKNIEPIIASLEDQRPILDRISEVDAVVYCAYGYNSADVARNEVESKKTHLDQILQAMQNTGKTFVLISGTGVIPDSRDIVYTESTPLPPTDSPVTLARRNLETKVVDAANAGIHSVVLRPPCVHGKGGSFIVPRYLLDHALSARESIYVEGCENNKRSAVHIYDLADLVLLAITSAPSGSIYWTAAETGVTSLSIAESVSRAAGLDGKAKAVSLERAQEIFGHWGAWWSLNSQCSGDLARKELGWKPQGLSLLEDIERGSYVEKRTTTIVTPRN